MTISADILRDNFKWRYVNLENRIRAMEVFLVSLDMYEKVHKTVDFKSKEIKEMKIQEDAHLKLFNHFRSEFCEWLAKEPFYKEEYTYLEVN